VNDAIELGEQRYVEMSAAEQFVLTISERGFGKRSSSYEYRITGRRRKKVIVAMGRARARRHDPEETGKLIASFPVEDGDQLMLVTTAASSIRHARRGHPHRGALDPGVIVFNTAEASAWSRSSASSEKARRTAGSVITLTRFLSEPEVHPGTKSGTSFVGTPFMTGNCSPPFC